MSNAGKFGAGGGSSASSASFSSNGGNGQRGAVRIIYPTPQGQSNTTTILDRGLPVEANALSWSPSNITTYAWFDGDDNTTIYTDTAKTTNATNGQDVQLWADKSGNSRDIQKIGTSNVPNYNSSGLNSKGVLQSNVYDGLEHQLSTNFTSRSWEVYTVVKVNNASGSADNYPRIMTFGAASGNDYDNANGFLPLLYHNVSSYFYSYQINTGPQVSGYTTGTFRLASSRSDGTTAYVSLDGGTETTSSKSFTANATGFRLFAPVQTGIGNNLSSSGAASDSFLDGAIAELVFISGNLSNGNKQKLEGYLSHKWGLEGNLPSGHPYKTEAP